MQNKEGTAPLVVLDPAKPPLKSIPHAEYPRVVYKHPREPFRAVEHRNTRHEVVDEEIVPNEHLAKAVADEKELRAALAEGWVKEPYIPKPVPDTTAHIYDEKPKGDVKGKIS
jgi:hypothetical protein